MSGIFISYRRDDASAWAGRLYEHLTTAFGADRVFMDVDSINLGEDFLVVIERYIDDIDVMLVMIGRHWLDAVDAKGRRRLDDEGDFVAIEVGRALEGQCRVIPVLVDNAQMPSVDELPPRLQPLARRNAVELTHAGFSRDIERLIASLTPILEAAVSPEPTPEAEPVAEREPEASGSEPPPPDRGEGTAIPGERPRRRVVVAAVGASAVLLAVAVWLVAGGGGGGSDAARGDCAQVDMAVSPEKAELLTDLADRFNESDRAQVDGRCVIVEPQTKSSGLSASLLVDGWDNETEGPEPVIWSPAFSGWGAIVDQRLAERGDDPIAREGTAFMLTPLVIAMPQPMAEALGWPDTPVGWRDLFELATSESGWADVGHPEWGRFRLGKTNPHFSTSGLTSLIAQTYAATGATEGLTSEDLRDPETVEFATGVESSVVHYGDTTLTFLDNLYRADARGRGLTYTSAVAVEEKSVIDYNTGNPDGLLEEDEQPTPPRVPLVAIYPEEGTVLSDNPFFVLDAPWVSDLEREAAEAFEEFVQEPVNQERVLEYGFRPANPDVPLGPPIVTGNGVDPTQPEALLEVPEPPVMVELLERWDEQRKPARVEILIDVSGSMGDPAGDTATPTKMDLAIEAAVGAIDQFSTRDVVGLRVFTTRLGAGGSVNIAGTDWLQVVPPRPVDEAQRRALEDAIEELIPLNGTPLYDATEQTYEDLEDGYEEDSINALVLLSDGVNSDNNTLDDADQLEALLVTLGRDAEGERAQPVRVFAVSYGTDADLATLEQIAQASDGAVYNATDPSTIQRVLAAVLSNF